MGQKSEIAVKKASVSGKMRIYWYILPKIFLVALDVLLFCPNVH